MSNPDITPQDLAAIAKARTDLRQDMLHDVTKEELLRKYWDELVTPPVKLRIYLKAQGEACKEVSNKFFGNRNPRFRNAISLHLMDCKTGFVFDARSISEARIDPNQYLPHETVMEEAFRELNAQSERRVREGKLSIFTEANKRADRIYVERYYEIKEAMVNLLSLLNKDLIVVVGGKAF